MKTLLLLLSFSSSLVAYGQTASKYLENGKLKLEQNDEASALNDFTKAIETDAAFDQAYYYRATILFNNKKYKEAIIDLDQAIVLNPKYTAALILRGNSSIKIDQKEKACEDFMQAKQLGDSLANPYILEYFCEYKPKKGENIVLDFPEQENWHITYQDFADKQNIFLLGRSNETLEQWTEQAGICAFLGIKSVDLVEEMNDFFQLEKQTSPKAKLTFLEKDLSAQHPWIMYAVESVYNKEGKCYESKMCYLIQGEQSFYSCFRSVKGKSLSAEQKARITKFFKTCEIVYEKGQE